MRLIFNDRSTIAFLMALFVASPLAMPVSEAAPSLDLPGDDACNGSTESNPRPAAWFSLGKPSQRFADDCFHQYMVNNPDTPHIQVLIIPSPGQYVARDLNLVYQSIDMMEWGLRDGARLYGMDWFADGFDISVTVWDEETPLEESPDIIVVQQNAMWPFGYAFVGQGSDQISGGCHPFSLGYGSVDDIRNDPTFSDHHGNGWGTTEAECDNGGRVCTVVSANAADISQRWGARNYYDLFSHEFGHCLGLGHTGDASDFAAKMYPPDDIMSYEQDPHDPNYALCISNLNIKTAAYIYNPLIEGAPALDYSPIGGYITMEGGSNPTPPPGENTLPVPWPESSWRVIGQDGRAYESASDCYRPDLTDPALPGDTPYKTGDGGPQGSPQVAISTPDDGAQVPAGDVTISGDVDREADGGTGPDSDGDGVPDAEDDCVDEAGPASNNGCPEGSTGQGTELGTDAVGDIPNTKVCDVGPEPPAGDGNGDVCVNNPGPQNDIVRVGIQDDAESILIHVTMDDLSVVSEQFYVNTAFTADSFPNAVFSVTADVKTDGTVSMVNMFMGVEGLGLANPLHRVTPVTVSISEDTLTFDIPRATLNGAPDGTIVDDVVSQTTVPTTNQYRSIDDTDSFGPYTVGDSGTESAGLSIDPSTLNLVVGQGSAQNLYFHSHTAPVGQVDMELDDTIATMDRNAPTADTPSVWVIQNQLGGTNARSGNSFDANWFYQGDVDMRNADINVTWTASAGGLPDGATSGVHWTVDLYVWNSTDSEPKTPLGDPPGAPTASVQLQAPLSATPAGHSGTIKGVTAYGDRMVIAIRPMFVLDAIGPAGQPAAAGILFYDSVDYPSGATITPGVAAPLTTDAGGPYSGDVDAAISLDGATASDGTPPYSFEWDLDNDGIYEAASIQPTFTRSSEGTYTVGLRVTDSASAIATDTATVSVTDGGGGGDAERVEITVGTDLLATVPVDTSVSTSDSWTDGVDLSAYAGQSITLTATWKEADGSTIASDSVQLDVGEGTETVTGTLEITSHADNDEVSEGAVTFEGTASRDGVTDPLSVAIDQSTLSGNEGDTLHYTSTVTGGEAPLTCNWSTDGGAPTITNDDCNGADIRFDLDGTHTVTLDVSDSGSGSASDTAQAVISDPAEPLTVEAGGPYSGDTGTAVDVTAVPTGGAGSHTCAWTVTDSPGGTGGTFDDASACSTTFTGPVDGAYTLTVTATDADSATATDTASLTLSAPVQVTVPLAVHGIIDSGINPYHADFLGSNVPDAALRALTTFDGSEEGCPDGVIKLDGAGVQMPFTRHPACYVEGYPEDAVALDLTLGGYNYAADSQQWNQPYTSEQVVWVPGTKIIGLTFRTADYVDASVNTHTMADHMDTGGHGTASASVAAGAIYGSCKNCLLVSAATDTGINAPPEAVLSGMQETTRHVVGLDWIDTVSRSMGPRANIPGAQDPTPVPDVDRTAMETQTAMEVREAAERGLTYANSAGNGNANAFVTPNQAVATETRGPDWNILVGAANKHSSAVITGEDVSDSGILGDGNPADWSSYGMGAYEPGQEGHIDAACHNGYATNCGHSGTSSATPIATGYMAAALLEARRVLDDPNVGQYAAADADDIRQAIAVGDAQPGNRLLADGVLQRGELWWTAFNCASDMRVAVGAIDGQFIATDAPNSHIVNGYGIANDEAFDCMKKVFHEGIEPCPNADEDAWDEAVEAARDAFWGDWDGNGDGAPGGSHRDFNPTDCGDGGEGNNAPVLAGIGAQSVEPGSELTFTVSASDADGDTLTLTMDSDTVPAGSFTDNGDGTGDFSWTPADEGSHQATFTVSDGNGGTDSETIVITVASSGGGGGPVCDDDADDDALSTAAGDGEIIEFCAQSSDSGLELTTSMAAMTTSEAFMDAESVVSWAFYIDDVPEPVEVNQFAVFGGVVVFDWAAPEGEDGRAAGAVVTFDYENNQLSVLLPTVTDASEVRVKTLAGEGAVGGHGPHEGFGLGAGGTPELDASPDEASLELNTDGSSWFGEAGQAIAGFFQRLFSANDAAFGPTPGETGERVELFLDGDFVDSDPVDTTQSSDQWAITTMISGEGDHTVVAEWYTADDQLVDTQTITVTVPAGPNNPPEADATADATSVEEGGTVGLDASGSSDPDDDTLTFAWSDDCGGGFSATDVAQSTWTAPAVDSETTCTITVTVSDGELDDSASVQVTVTPTANQAPVADAGSDLDVQEGASVQLDGSGSSDPDGTIATYQWTQTGGPDAVDVSGADTDTLSFTAPDVGPEGATLTFNLQVTDDQGASADDTVLVTVSEDSGCENSCTNVNNKAPTVTQLDTDAASYDNASAITVSVTGVAVDDNGAEDIASITAAWFAPGDDTANPVTVTDRTNGTSGDASFAFSFVLDEGAEGGTYTLEVTATDDDGASDTGSVTFEVGNSDGVSIAFTQGLAYWDFGVIDPGAKDHSSENALNVTLTRTADVVFTMTDFEDGDGNAIPILGNAVLHIDTDGDGVGDGDPIAYSEGTLDLGTWADGSSFNIILVIDAVPKPLPDGAYTATVSVTAEDGA